MMKNNRTRKCMDCKCEIYYKPRIIRCHDCYVKDRNEKLDERYKNKTDLNMFIYDSDCN